MRHQAGIEPASHRVGEHQAALPAGLARAVAELAASTGPVHAVEVGGSSVQSAVPDAGGHVVFTPGPRPDLDQAPYGLSAPGLVIDGRVFGAHHLGWDGTEAWRELGYRRPPLISLNDAEASALGEWLLRQDRPEPPTRVLYIGIGTGVGASLISGGEIVPIELSHQPGFGDAVCGGCGRKGCLDAQIGGHALSARLTEPDRLTVAEKLSTAIERAGTPAGTLVVFGGGLARTYPGLLLDLRKRLAGSDYRAEPTAAPAEAKSAAFVALLDRLVIAGGDRAPGSE